MTLTQDTEHRITELKTALNATGQEITRLSNTWKDEGGKLVVSGEQHKAYLDKVNEGEQLRQAIIAEQKAAGIFEFLEAPATVPDAGRDAAQGQQPEVKSAADVFLSSDAYQQMKSTDFTVGGRVTMDTGIPALAAAAMQRKDVYTAMGGTIEIPVIGRAQDVGFTERTLRPGRVRDLFPAERSNAAMLYGIRETGFTNRAAVVPERTAADGGPATGGPTDVFGLKPRSDIAITPVTYPFATIAHIMYVHRRALDDEPRMRGILDRDMIDGVKMAEDEQLLWGNGVGDNLTGLMNTPGVQAYTGLATDRTSAQIRRAATRAILAYFQPTGVVMHPFDWENIELETDNNGAYTVAVSVAVGGEKRVWRLNVSDTPAMTQGNALVGAFGTGAKIYDREAVNIQVSTENRDLFERNAYTLRAEERLGLVVDRPESFVHLDLTPFAPTP